MLKKETSLTLTPQLCDFYSGLASLPHIICIVRFPD